MTQQDIRSSEFSFLCGLVELTWDDPTRARSACLLVRHDDIADDLIRDSFRLIDDVLSTVEAPRAADLARHELWPDARAIVGDAIQESARVGKGGFSLGVERFARYIRDAATRRRVADAVTDLEQLSRERGTSSVAILQAAEAVKAAAESVEAQQAPLTLVDAIQEYIRNPATPKVQTGFGPLDRLTGGGLPIGGLTVFAAPPSVGKSALALQAAIGALDCDDNLTVVWCMGEMTLDAMARRALCHWSTRRDDMHAVTMQGAEGRTDLAKGAALHLGGLLGNRFRLVQPPLTIGAIEDAVVESGARLLVIDYVQLVEMEAADRRAEIDGIVKRLRRLSLERDVAIVAISNVAKAVEAATRIGAIGKESSELDFAADLFLLGVPDEDREPSGTRLVRWVCKKNRHGPCEDLLTRFDGALQTFTDAAALPVDDFSDWR